MLRKFVMRRYPEDANRRYDSSAKVAWRQVRQAAGSFQGLQPLTAPGKELSSADCTVSETRMIAECTRYQAAEPEREQ
jgi:hypothetical protein